jgi:hypothetical protein
VDLVEMMILYHKNYFFTVGSGQFAVTSGFDSYILPKKTQKVSNLGAFWCFHQKELVSGKFDIWKIGIAVSNQSTNQPINQSTNQPINQSTNQPLLLNHFHAAIFGL